MDNINGVLGENIRKYRKMMNLTQEELADKIGVTYQAVSKWENAQSAPDVSFLPLLADVFGCNIDDLFSRVSLKNTGFTDADDADILQRATTIALETGRISTALLQRKLRVSYSQAVRIINEIEQRGIIGPMEGISHARCVCAPLVDNICDNSASDDSES